MTPGDYAMTLVSRGHTAQSIFVATGVNVRVLTVPRTEPKPAKVSRVASSNPTPASILRGKINEEMSAICNRHGVSIEKIMAVGRPKRTVWARQEIMYVLHRKMRLPLGRVGMILNNRHHTTILSGVRAHEARAEKMGWRV